MPNKTGFLMVAVLGFVALASVGFRANAQNRGNAQDAEPQKEKMMMQCPMMDALKSLQLPADAPPVLLAQEEQLKLTAEQQAKLREIAESARQQAREVLNEEQREQLAEAPSGPLSPMQLASTLMKGHMEKSADSEAKQMCPMCKKMMGQKQGHQDGKQGRGGGDQDRNRSNPDDQQPVR